MFCRKCGKMIADDAAFCSYCGTPTAIEPATIEVAEEMPEVAPEVSTFKPEIPEVKTEEPVIRKPIFDEFQWDVNDYPDTNVVAKTEDIDFDWNADPNEIRDRFSEQPEPQPIEFEEPAVQVAPPTQPEPEEMSAAERIDKFYTFNKKNEEFQQLLNREYQKVKAGSAISYELSEADHLAEERFDQREPDTSMDAFLEREGVVKPYEPKPFESDVLARIEAQEEAREMRRREEEAREAALEAARKEAEEKMKAEEEARIRAEEEARIRAEEAFKEAERLKEEARLRAEEVARFKAEEEARAKAEAEARAKAEEEARIRAEEEAKFRAEEEARLKAEEEAARVAAEEKAREEARLKAEAEARAAREAEKIRAQREARMAIEAEERERAEQERRKEEEAKLRARLAEEQAALSRQADNAAVEQEARKVLEQTARMREAEAAKIRAAIAGIKGEIAAKSVHDKVAKPEPPAPVEPPKAPVVEPAVKEPLFEAEAPTIPAEPEIPVAPVFHKEPTRPEAPAVPQPVQFADTVAIQRGDVEIEKAQQATRDRITKMAKAREDFFADFEPEKPVTGRETMLSSDSDLTRTKSIDKAAILAAMDETRRISREEMRAVEEPAPVIEPEPVVEEPAPVIEEPAPVVVEEPAPVVVEEPAPIAAEEPVETVEDLLSQFESANNLPFNEEAVSAVEPEVIEPEVEEPVVAEPVEEVIAEMPAVEPEIAIPEVEPVPAPVIEPEEDVIIAGDLAAAVEKADAAFEETASDLQQEAMLVTEPEIPEEGFAVKEEPAVVPDAAASVETKHGLEDTIVVPEKEMIPEGFVSDFDSYGEAEAAQLRAQQEAAAENFFAEEPAAEEVKEKAEKGGAGRLILKIILILLIIIFALELAGIGIKFLAPQSQAAETIDNQLNKIIHLITGEENTQSDDYFIV